MASRYTGPAFFRFAGSEVLARALVSRSRVVAGIVLERMARQSQQSLAFTETHSDGSIIQVTAFQSATKVPVVHITINTPTAGKEEKQLEGQPSSSWFGYVPMYYRLGWEDPYKIGEQVLVSGEPRVVGYGDDYPWYQAGFEDQDGGLWGDLRVIKRDQERFHSPYVEVERGIKNGYCKIQDSHLNYWVREAYSDGEGRVVFEDRGESAHAVLTQIWYKRKCLASYRDDAKLGGLIGEDYEILPTFLPVCGDHPWMFNPNRLRVHGLDYGAEIEIDRLREYDYYYTNPAFPKLVGPSTNKSGQQGGGGLLWQPPPTQNWIPKQYVVSQNGDVLYFSYDKAEAPGGEDSGRFVKRLDMGAGFASETDEEEGLFPDLYDQEIVEEDIPVDFAALRQGAEDYIREKQAPNVGAVIVIIGGVYYVVLEEVLIDAVNNWDNEPFRTITLVKPDSFTLRSPKVGLEMRDNELSWVSKRTDVSFENTRTAAFGAVHIAWMWQATEYHYDGDPPPHGRTYGAWARDICQDNWTYNCKLTRTDIVKGLFGSLVTYKVTSISSGESRQFYDTDADAWDFNNCESWNCGWDDVPRYWEKHDEAKKEEEFREILLWDAHNDVLVYKEWTSKETREIDMTSDRNRELYPAYREDITEVSEVEMVVKVGKSPGTPAKLHKTFRFKCAPERVIKSVTDIESAYVGWIHSTTFAITNISTSHDMLTYKTQQGELGWLAYASLRSDDDGRPPQLIIAYSEQRDPDLQVESETLYGDNTGGEFEQIIDNRLGEARLKDYQFFATERGEEDWPNELGFGDKSGYVRDLLCLRVSPAGE